MPPWSEAIISTLVIWLALLLTVLKRDWRSINRRVRATAAGRRRHPFGPPRRSGKGASSFKEALVSELPRVFELGVPLWLLALAAEMKGVRAREIEAERWAGSPAGWLHDRLQGQVTEDEFHRRLADHGLPLPAPKARYGREPQYTMPPMSWLREWKARTPPEEPASGLAEIAGLAFFRRRPDDPKLRIQMMGRLSVHTADGRDLTGRLDDRPMISYLFQYLLLRTIIDPGRPVSRRIMGDEFYPGQKPRNQLHNVRNRLDDLKRYFPELAGVLTITDRDVSLRVEACAIDVLDSLRLATHGVTGSLAQLSDADANTIREAAVVAGREFIPDWDSLQESINGGRGAAEDLVRDLRMRMTDVRATLLTALGGHHLARGENERAVETLNEAFALAPDLPGLAEHLAEALDSAGHAARATKLREDLHGPA